MKRKTAVTLTKAGFHFSFVLFALATTAGPMLLENAGIINTTFNIATSTGSGSAGGNTYFDTKFNSMDEVKEESKKLIEETMKEGAVLLKNDNNALPLAQGNSVNLYGVASHYSVLTGMGSSSFKVNGDQDPFADKVTLAKGLSDAGLTVNETLDTWYQDNGLDYVGDSGSHFIGYEDQEVQTVVEDAPWDALPGEKTSKADAAIMVLARNSGEAVDLYMDTKMDDGKTRTIVSKRHNGDPDNSVGDALALTQNEKDVLSHLKQLKASGTISKIIVVMNSASPLQCSFLEDEEYGVDAAMWVGTLGTNGANAIGKLLTGEYNFSGRTADTFWAESKCNPVYYNFGSYEYGNSSALANYFATLGEYNNKFYVAYQEGIYNGYKYSETRYEDVLLERENVGEFDYEAAVTYPFGYGLSYSTFSYSNFAVEENKENDTYTLTVDVTNESEIDGKEVVQAYVQKPYTKKDIENGVEKASVELVGFTKVDVPAKATVQATIEVEGKYLASYDANVEKTYVIGSEDEKDDYLFTVAMDAHDAVNNILQYKAEDGETVNLEGITQNDRRGKGDSSLVFAKHFAYDNKTYSTNDHIEEENEGFTPRYEGEEANFGVDKITNQFDDTDFQKAGYFSDEEASQVYLSRSNWVGTYGKVIKLTATSALVEAQKNPGVEKDKIAYPTYDELGFYESSEDFDEIKLIYLRGKDYDDPLWETLLDRVSWDETCTVLQDALRYTKGMDSIAAPMTSQQNGAISPVHSRTDGAIPEQNAFRGFAEEKKSGTDIKPTIFLANGTVAATYNKDLIYRVGRQTGEEAAWAGYNGIYGLGVNIHRGAYCGRTFEYYSEDGYLTGVAAGYEAAGLHDMGVFVLAKHAVLNDQETHRAGLNVWANEQSIREIYCRALEVAIELDRKLSVDAEGNRTHMPVLGVMTGMNRLGAKWTGGQGFLNTVLRAEFGMTSYAISDYNSSRPYMNPIQGVLYGNDLPDGNPAGAKGGYDYDGNDIRFQNYKTGYGELAWKMRDAIKNVLYTVVNSNAMNGVTGDTAFQTITPLWEKLVPVVQRVTMVLFGWGIASFAIVFVFDLSKRTLEEHRLRIHDDK